MKISKLTLAVVTALSASAASTAFAIDLYVDTRTKQIYAEPGPHREMMGSFERKADDAQAPATDNSELAAIKEDLELKTNEIKALEEHAKEAEENKIKLDDGIEFKSKDGNFKAAINGRMQVDSQFNFNQNDVATPDLLNSPGSLPNTLNDGVNIRRARLGVEGTFFKDWDYKFEYDFSRGNGTVAAGITDAFIRYNFSKPFSVKVGSFKEPFSLEEATSNRFLTFIERNMAVNSFVDNPNTYKTGVGANYWTDRWQIAGALQTEPVGGWASNTSVNSSNGNNSRNNGSGNTGWEVVGRVTGLPWFESKTKFLHVGASGSYTSVNTAYNRDGTLPGGTSVGGNSVGQGVTFTAFPAANVDRTNVLTTGGLSRGNQSDPGSFQVDSFNRYGAEAALVYGPFSAQAEYLQTDIAGKGYNDNSLRGYYGYMSYFLTGESRAYKAKTAAWDRIKPSRNFDFNGGWGAWEVAVGYDYLNLIAGPINGGRADLIKFGLNWYPNSHIRLMGNFVHVLDVNTANNNANGGGPTVGNNAQARSRAFDNASFDMLEFRTQVDF